MWVSLLFSSARHSFDTPPLSRIVSLHREDSESLRKLRVLLKKAETMTLLFIDLAIFITLFVLRMVTSDDTVDSMETDHPISFANHDEEHNLFEDKLHLFVAAHQYLVPFVFLGLFIVSTMMVIRFKRTTNDKYIESDGSMSRARIMLHGFISSIVAAMTRYLSIGIDR